MDALIVVLVVIGLLIPIAVGAGIVLFAVPKSDVAHRGMAIAFGKGIGLGVVLGLTVSAVSVAGVLGVACLAGR